MFKQEPSSAISPASQAGCLDPLDIDRYIDFDQAYHPSPSISPSSSHGGKATATPEFLTINPNNTLIQPQSINQQTLTGPSHQYELYKQHTGLPVGALAAITSAVDQPVNFSYQQNLAQASTDGLFGMSSTDEFFDFNTAPDHNSSFSNSSDIDMEFDSPQDLFISTNSSQTSSADYIDPSAIGGHEDTSAASTPIQSNVGRLWPGMHQQQANMAKAQAQAQQQKRVQQQQQQQQQQQASSTIQHPQALHRSQSRQVTPRLTGNLSRPPTDPVVEERISRLLNEMRQSSVASTVDDDAATPNVNGMSHLARQRKEEEDMDEDERLLASEEGKKLSSKERRQLRNKVSARAFRSRRKEYIGQLEGEVAVKAKEADDLRTENDALRAENTRLTDLTRMLLSSSAFSSFLNDLSSNGVSGALESTSTSGSSPTPASNTRLVQSRPRKDINPQQQQSQQLHQNGPQVGMALLPENNMDFTVFDTTNEWAGNMDTTFNYAQVFSLTELPQGPAVDRIDFGTLSGKASNTVGSYSYDEAKTEAPIIESMPEPKEELEASSGILEQVDDLEFDESDPAFALFSDYSSTIKTVTVEPQYQIFGTIETEKAFAHLDLVVTKDDDDGEVGAATMERFERMCSNIEAASARIAAVTSHLR